MSKRQGRIVCLSNVYDQTYHDLRGEEIHRCLSWAKRRDLFRCLTQATGRQLLVLSAPPKALGRRSFKWLPSVATTFCEHPQYFCANWDGPKLRVPLSWVFYIRHALRHTRSGDFVLIDNYELIYILAAWIIRLFRQVKFVLDYEDGKHLIDRSWSRVLSGLAEFLGRPLLSGSLLAHPALGERLRSSLPKELVPGFIPHLPPTRNVAQPEIVRFLYSGSLDHARGIELLLAAVPFLPAEGWRLDIAGAGPLAGRVDKVSREPKWKGKVFFHHSLAWPEFEPVLAASHVGLNCQLSADPISGVTFPSKIFTYLSAGLMIVSSKASDVETICGNACLFFTEETPQALGATMSHVVKNFSELSIKHNIGHMLEYFSIEGTAARLRIFLAKVEA